MRPHSGLPVPCSSAQGLASAAVSSAQVPGLFEGDEYATLMTQCKEGAQKEGLMLDSHEELYKWFTSQVIRNLHVVFTMNPSSEGLKDRAATSPALFNRYWAALSSRSRGWRHADVVCLSGVC